MEIVDGCPLAQKFGVEGDAKIAAGLTPPPPGGAGPAGPPASAPEPAGGEPGTGA